MNDNIPDTVITNLAQVLIAKTQAANWTTNDEVATIYKELSRIWFQTKPEDAYQVPDLGFPEGRRALLDQLHQIFQRQETYGEEKRTGLDYEIDSVCHREVAVYRTRFVAEHGRPHTPPSPTRGRSHSPVRGRGRSYSPPSVRSPDRRSVQPWNSPGTSPRPRSSSVNRTLFSRTVYTQPPVSLEHSLAHPQPRPPPVRPQVIQQSAMSGSGNTPPSLQDVLSAYTTLQQQVTQLAADLQLATANITNQNTTIANQNTVVQQLQADLKYGTANRTRADYGLRDC